MIERLSLRALLFLAFAVLLGAGCRSGSDAGDADTTGTTIPSVEAPFGDAYEVVTSETMESPDVMPYLSGDTLFARVAYPGGCTDHDFDLNYEIEQDTASLWLVHSDGGDDCEAYLNDEVVVTIPEDARRASTVVLRNPQGGPPHILRWGTESGQ